MGFKGLITKDIILAREGNEEAKAKVIDHYGYIFERITEELKIKEEEFEDINGAMLLGMLKTIAQEESMVNFPLYAYRNMRKEAEKCLQEIACLGPMEEVEWQDYSLEDTLDNVCAEILVDQMLKYLNVSSRQVLFHRFGIEDEDIKAFKEIAVLLDNREVSTTVANLSRIANDSMKGLRKWFQDKYNEES